MEHFHPACVVGESTGIDESPKAWARRHQAEISEADALQSRLIRMKNALSEAEISDTQSRINNHLSMATHIRTRYLEN